MVGIVIGVVVLGLGACGALVAVVVNATTPYVDVANDYLDALREADPAAADALFCGGAAPDGHRGVLGQTTGQDLTSVNVVNGVGRVDGTVSDITGEATSRIELEVRTVDDAGCVSGVILDGRQLP